MWLDNIYVFNSRGLGLVIGQNNQYDQDKFIDSIAVIFKAGEPTRIQLVDAETYDVQRLVIPDEIVGIFLAKFLTEVIKYFSKKENERAVLPG